MGAANRGPENDTAKCAQCPVRNRSFCGSAQGQAFIDLAGISRIRRFRAGETIIAQKDRSHLVGNVLQGVLKLVKSLSDGRTHIVGLLHPSDFFGRLYSASSEFSLEAATEVELCTIERGAFEAYLAKYPSVEHELYIANLSQLDNARERTMLLACQSTLERLAAYLALRLLQIEMALIEAPKGGRIVVPSTLNRRDFAGYLGTTVETISRNVQFLARAGIIRILDSGHFEVVKRNALFDLSGQSEEDLAASLAAGRSRRPATLKAAQESTARLPIQIIRTASAANSVMAP
jgi:CRP/FNR family transcriptional regulator, anaerobic regulatory protein